MKLHVLMLSHGRPELGLASIRSAINAYKFSGYYDNLVNRIEVSFHVGINNDPEELMDSKYSLYSSVEDLVQGFELNVMKLTEGISDLKMSKLRSKMFNTLLAQELLSPEDFYFWLDDDDVLHPEIFRYFELMYNPDHSYYQFNYTRLNDINYSYISNKDQTFQLNVKKSSDFSIAPYEQYIGTGLEYFRPSLASGQIYNVALSDGMYDQDLNINACEDIYPSLKYLDNLKGMDTTVCLSSAQMFIIKLSNTVYSLEEQLNTIVKLSNILPPGKERDTQVLNMLKYCSYNCYHHRRYKLDEPWLIK